jgi:hypothetical protein
MKKILYPIITFFFVSLIAANVYSADKVTKTFDYKDFSSIDVSSGMYLNVTQSDNYSIEIKADESDFKYLKVEKKGETLKIYFHKSFFSFFKKHNKVEINIKMPALAGLDLSGGSHANIQMDNSSKSFSADMSGGAYLEGNLSCGDAYFDISGGSGVNMTGKGKNLKIEGSGGSKFKLKDFSVDNVNADMSGGSHATVTMNGTLNTEQSGGSRIVYYGNMTLGQTDFSGGSGVSKGD